MNELDKIQEKLKQQELLDSTDLKKIFLIMLQNEEELSRQQRDE